MKDSDSSLGTAQLVQLVHDRYKQHKIRTYKLDFTSVATLILEDIAFKTVQGAGDILLYQNQE